MDRKTTGRTVLNPSEHFVKFQVNSATVRGATRLRSEAEIVRKLRYIWVARRIHIKNLFAIALNRAEFTFGEVLVPWVLLIGVLGFLVAWLVVAIMERTGLSRYVWHLPLFFVALVVLISSVIGLVVSP
jgi:hypothetical protein